MPQATASHDKVGRTLLRASGAEEVLLQLPRETIALLDELKEKPGPAEPQPGAVATDRTGEKDSRSPKMRKPTRQGGL